MKNINLADSLFKAAKLKISIKSLKTWEEVFKFLDCDLEIAKGLCPKDLVLSVKNFSEFFPRYLKLIENKKIEEPIFDDTEIKDIKVPSRNPLQKVDLFNFQKSKTYTLFRDIVEEKYLAQYLIAGTGAGKTIMFGQVLRWLYDTKDFFKDCLGPYKTMVITKANAVDPTEEHLVKKFGLSPKKDGLLVLNYEMLRSSYGKRLLRKDTVYIKGEPQDEWHWHPGMNPKVIIIDEAHSVKNDNATQTLIVRALAKITWQSVYTIFVSATPWAKLSEAKTFCLLCKLDFNPYKPINI